MASSPPSSAPTSIPFLGGLTIQVQRLESGLELAVVEDPSAAVVAWQTWYRVGSAMEEEGRTGLAHLFEHMMFKGTSDYEDGAYSRILDGEGARGLNAWTWLDETVYTVAVPAGAVETVARLEASRMRHLALEEESFQTEREVVLNERRFRVDDSPDGRMSEELYRLLFPDHLYGRPTIGWERDVAALTLEDCRRFYDRWYQPSNAFIVLVGKITPQQALEVVGRHFTAPSVAPPAQPAPPPPASPGVVMPMDLPIAQDRLLVAWQGPPRSHRDTAALLVLDAILSSGHAGRLQRRLVDGGLAGSVDASLPPFRLHCPWEVGAAARPGVEAEELLGAIQDELDTLARDGVAPEEVERGARQLKAGTWRSLADAAGRADMVGIHQVAMGDWAGGPRLLEQVERVTAEDVSLVAARYLTPERRAAVLGRSEGERGRRDPPPPTPSGAGPSAPLPPGSGPAPAWARGRDVLELDQGGAKVALAWDPALPMVDFKLALPFGSTSDPAGMEGLAAASMELLLRGTASRGRWSFEESMERLGAEVGVQVLQDLSVISGSVPVEAWRATAALLGEALREPALRDEDLEQVKKEHGDEVREAREDDRSLAMLAFLQAFYPPGHPCRHSPGGTVAGIEALDAEAVRGFLAEHMRRGGAALGLAGALDEGAERDAEGLLEALGEGSPRAPGVTPPPLSEGLRFLVVDKPGRTQAQIVGGLPGPRWGAPHQGAFRLGNEVFGGGTFSARLMVEIRETRGWSYGAASWPSPGRTGASWQWWTFTSLENAVPAVELVLEMIDALLRKGIDDEELEQARRLLVRGAPFLVDTVEKRLWRAMDRILTGNDPLRDLEEIRQAGSEQVVRVMAPHLRASSHAVALVGPADALAPALEGLGEVEVLPWTEVGA